MQNIRNKNNLSRLMITSVAMLYFFSTNAAYASDTFNLYSQEDIEKRCPSIKDSLVIKLHPQADYREVFNVAYGVKKSTSSLYYKPTYTESSIFDFKKNNLASIVFGSDSYIPTAKTRASNKYGTQGYDTYTTTFKSTNLTAQEKYIVIPRDVLFLVIESGTDDMVGSLIQRVLYDNREGNSLSLFTATKRHNNHSGWVNYTPDDGASDLPKKFKLTEQDYIYVFAGGKQLNWWETSNTELMHMKDNNNKNIVCPG
jgi:hypothetical protein